MSKINEYKEKAGIETVGRKQLERIFNKMMTKGHELGPDKESIEVIRLAILGCWALEHGLPTLEFYASKRHYEFNHTTHENYIWNDQGKRANDAVEKL